MPQVEEAGLERGTRRAWAAKHRDEGGYPRREGAHGEVRGRGLRSDTRGHALENTRVTGAVGMATANPGTKPRKSAALAGAGAAHRERRERERGDAQHHAH